VTVALNLGGIIRLTYTVKNDAGQATNPSTVTLTIIQPDGTTATPAVTLPPVATGLLIVDFIPTQAGLHSAHWATANPTTAEDDMFVAEAPARLLVSVDDAVDHLKARDVITSDADREQLQWLCLVVSEAVEGDLSRTIVRRTITETHSGGGSLLRLRQTPVLSVTSVTVSGVLLANTGYVLDTDLGILYAGSTSTASTFAAGLRNVVVVYVVGIANPPKSARLVALTALQSLWQQSQQAPHRLLDEQAEFAVTSAVAGLPDPLRNAYESLRAVGVA
jgi:hypothetical protein